MKLYGYFRSSAAYRVRIALNLKEIEPELAFVHLTRNGGEQHSAAYRALNPAGLVPALETDDGQVLTQSLAIIEYLDEVVPTGAPLLPKDPLARAQARSVALAIACDIHPINNLRVLQYLTKNLGVSEEQKNAWYRHWVETGLESVEQMLARSAFTGAFCVGDVPSLADICLIPQIANARRFSCKIDHLERVLAINARCLELPAFAKAQPAAQPDAE